jgi:hypothetical protein
MMSGDIILLESGYCLLDFTRDAGIELPTQWMGHKVTLKELSDFAEKMRSDMKYSRPLPKIKSSTILQTIMSYIKTH